MNREERQAIRFMIERDIRDCKFWISQYEQGVEGYDDIETYYYKLRERLPRLELELETL